MITLAECQRMTEENDHYHLRLTQFLTYLVTFQYRIETLWFVVLAPCTGVAIKFFVFLLEPYFGQYADRLEFNQSWSSLIFYFLGLTTLFALAYLLGSVFIFFGLGTWLPNNAENNGANGDFTSPVAILDVYATILKTMGYGMILIVMFVVEIVGNREGFRSMVELLSITTTFF